MPHITHTPQDFANLVAAKQLHFLLDVSWISYRGYFANRELTTTFKGKEIPSAHVYAVVRTIMSIKKRIPFATITLVKDGIDVARKKENEEYKGTRSPLPFDVHMDSSETITLSGLVPDVYYAYHPKQEADDVLFSLAKTLARTPGAQVILYTGDCDLLQAIQPNIHLLREWQSDPALPLPLLGAPYALEKFGVPIEVLPLFRAVTGDKSDNIKGVHGFPKAFLRKHLEKRSTIEELFDPHESYDDFPYKDATARKHMQYLIDNRPQVEKNYSMIKLGEIDGFNVERVEDYEHQMSLVQKWQLQGFESFLLAVR